MKILNREQFLKLPAGVLYSKFSPCWFDELTIKEETLETNDWVYQDLVGNVACSGSSDFSDILFEAKDEGTSFGLDFDGGGRDGFFDEEQLFAVYEKEDVLQLIARIQATVGDYPEI